jgi:ABC-type uncharacterized transport system substrate-binding protein
MHCFGRRRLLEGALALAVSSPLSACEKPAKAPRIGFLAVGSREGRARHRTGALIVPDDPLVVNRSNRVADIALKYRLPTIGGSKEMAIAGVLLSLGPDIVDQYRRCTDHVDKILKGAKPGDLPMEQPTKFDLGVNLKTARALGLTIPQSILTQATHVVESCWIK